LEGKLTRLLAVANLVRANCKGEEDEVAKLTLENFTPPELTSGTPESVLTAASHVI
jgi:hypothetical protein